VSHKVRSLVAVTTHFNISWTEARRLSVAEIAELMRIVELREEHERREERGANARARGLTPVMT